MRNIDVDKLCEDGEIDLLIGGSPCTDLSLAGKRRGMSTTTKEKVTSLSQYIDLKDAGFEFAGQSYLFWEFVRIFQRLRERNPKLLFLLENVEVGKEWDAVISDTLGIHGVHINSALVSAQNRKRIYWSNIRVREEGLFGYKYTDIPQPADQGILLRDILEKEVDEKYYLKNEVVRNLLMHKERNKKAGNGFGAVFHDTDGKMAAVKVKGCGMYDLIKEPTSHCLRIPEATKQGYVDNQQGEAFDITQPSSETRRGRKMADKCNCLTTEFQGNYLLFEGAEPNNHLQKNLTDVDSKANAFLATSHKGAWANGMSLFVQRGVIRVDGSPKASQPDRVYSKNGKSPTLGSNHFANTVNVALDFRIRRLTPTEYARLQTIPDWYIWECSETQQYRMLGNGWTVEVIRHIFSFIELDY